MISDSSISIVTPSYNQGEFIEKTIDSVLSQKCKDLQYIIIDGGSTDRSIEIIKKYEKYLFYWETAPDRGQSHAINKGLAKCSNTIFNWINSDDYYEPDALNIIQDSYKSKDVDIVCGRSRIFDQSGTVRYSRGSDIYAESIAKTIGWARMDQPETFVKTNLIKTLGGVSEDLHYLMDREWWIKYLITFGQDRIARINDVIVNFRLHNASKTVGLPKEFEVDHDSIYYSLARFGGLTALEDLIFENCAINKRYRLGSTEKFDFDIVKKSLMFYLLQTAERYYYFGDLKKARNFISHIVEDDLDSGSIQLLNKLKFRTGAFIGELISSFKRLGHGNRQDS